MDRDTLFALDPQEFEELCAALLRADGFQNVALVGGPDDQGVDISGESEGQRVAVQVKHTRRTLSGTDFQRIIHKVHEGSHQPDELIIITSSPIPASAKDAVHDVSADMAVRLMGQDEVLQLLNKHPEIRRSRVTPAVQRTKHQRWALRIGIGGALTSLAGILVPGLIGPEKPPLHRRIETVESAIGSLKDLEKQLTEIKQDMVEAEEATKAIKEEYAQAKELEKLTDEQLQAVKAALQRQSWHKTVVDYVLGFVFGVAASLTASVIYSRVRQRRALAAE